MRLKEGSKLTAITEMVELQLHVLFTVQLPEETAVIFAPDVFAENKYARQQINAMRNLVMAWLLISPQELEAYFYLRLLSLNGL
jgi:hypothetical protein